MSVFCRVQVQDIQKIMAEIRIRPAFVADAPLIAQVVAMAIGEDTMVRYCGSEYLRVLEQVAAAEGTQYSYQNVLVAEVDGVAAGAIVGYNGALLEPLREGTLSIVRKYNPSVNVVDEETQAGEFYIDSLGVLPQFRGCGVGKRLVMAMAGKGFVLGCSKIGLMVDFKNSGVLEFYSGCGFHPVGEKLFFGHKMHHLQCTHLPATGKIQYTGLNYPMIQEFCGDKILAPYICMGFSMLSLLGPDGFITVNEGDTICKDGVGNLWVE